MEEVNMILEMAQDGMQESVEHLKRELAKISTGKASPAMLGSIRVDYYGAPTPLAQVANVGTSDARTLAIKPWEKSMLAPIERAIFEANLGFTPRNDGETIHISIPMLTEERRRELVKRAKALGEDAKVSVRASRRDAMEEIKKAVKDGLPEDIGKRKETDVQELTNKYGSNIDQVITEKEKDIMTV
ncbi:MAG: ribosome recycling factor [Bacteroidota bacterium]